MQRKIILLSRRYCSALEKHLLQPQRGGLRLGAAQELGHQAVAIGLETLDMARIHDRALVQFEGSITSDTKSRRAGAFFAEAIHPIEETHLPARQARVRLDHLNATLHTRTTQLVKGNQVLKARILRRRSAEQRLRQSGEHQTKVLKESLQLQQRLRRLTHRLLVTQENERKKISQALRDEIAQTLLGINVRLLSLKTDATSSTKGLQKEIASTQRVVAKSAKTVHRIARGFERGL